MAALVDDPGWNELGLAHDHELLLRIHPGRSTNRVAPPPLRDGGLRATDGEGASRYLLFSVAPSHVRLLNWSFANVTTTGSVCEYLSSSPL